MRPNKRTDLRTSAIVIAVLGMFSLGADGCDGAPPPVSSSGVKKANVHVPVGADGLTAEQHNVGQRLQKDNEVGSIKHFYCISPYSGQTLIYSTVRGKVTSSGKRLTPTSVNGGYSSNGWYGGFGVNIGGNTVYTNEVLQDDGTYGSSAEYLFWWDTKGIYHQQYVAGGCIIHISDQPLAVKSVVINMEITAAPGTLPVVGASDPATPSPPTPAPSSRR